MEASLGYTENPILKKRGGGRGVFTAVLVFLLFIPAVEGKTVCWGSLRILWWPPEESCSLITSSLQRGVVVLASEPHGGQCCVLWSGLPRGSALYIGISKDKLKFYQVAGPDI